MTWRSPSHSSHHRHAERNEVKVDHLTNGIGWGGTGREGGKSLKTPLLKTKTGSYKTLIISLLIVVSTLTPYEAFTQSLLGKDQYQCVRKLWYKESRWNPQAISRTHDYGIPQRHMKGKSREAKERFLANPYSQILWGLGYIEHRYGSPCKAWAHSQRKGWY